MATRGAPKPVELIPPAPQTFWGWPAVLNFTCGGLGAGLYIVAALAAGFGASSAVALASWLGPALVVTGFVAVATEAGRPVRGLRVLARGRTSWMSRELWLGAAFVGLAGAEFVVGAPGVRLAATAAAAMLALAQGFILREARGVAAWAVPVMPGLFLSSALVSGGGLLILAELGQGGVSSRPLGGALVLLTLHVVVWWAYITWSREEAFVRSVQTLRDGRGALLIVGGGYLGPSLLFGLAVAFPGLAVPLATIGAAFLVASQLCMKAALLLRAGQLRPITLAGLRLRRSAR